MELHRLELSRVEAQTLLAMVRYAVKDRDYLAIANLEVGEDSTSPAPQDVAEVIELASVPLLIKLLSLQQDIFAEHERNQHNDS